MDGVLWRAFVEASPDVVLVVDPEGTILFVNRKNPVFAHRPIVGEKIWDFAVGDDAQARLRERIRQVVTSREAIHYEHPGVGRDGGPGWHEVRAIPVVVDGKVERILWASNDISERMLAKERLEASERRFRALVEHGSDCTVVIDQQGRIQYSSPAVTRTLGYEAAEMNGMQAADLVHPDDVATSGLGMLGGPHGASKASTIRLRHKDGSWRWLEGTATNLLDDPAVQGMVVNRLDVTERKKEEVYLAFQAAVLAQVNEPIMAATRQSIVTYWNAAAERLFGWTAAEVIGQSALEFFRTRYPNGRDEVVASVAATQAWRGPMVMNKKSGEPVTVETSIRMMSEHGDAIIVLQDVTAKRELEEQVRQSQKMEAIGLLAGGVAHDFNNLLAVILGFSELAARKLPPGHPVAQQLSEVFEAARRGGELTRKLLAFSRKQFIQRRLLDLGASVADFARLMGRIVGEDIELVVEPAPGPLVVRADAVQLEQVLLNLCTNARQAMPGGGTLRLTTAAVTLDDGMAHKGPYAQITVRDTGVGMDEKTRTRVFEPFFTTKAEGTGLGLATVYGIVQQHGGFVSVDSAPGLGTTFRVLLPLAADGEVPVSTPKGKPSESPRAGGNELVLVAEDEPSLRALVTATLTDLGYRVVAAADGEEAVREYERVGKDVSLVLLDVVMPRVGAREAYERIQAIKSDVRVLFMTGYAPESTRLAQLIESGRAAMLEKPFTPQALAAKVRSVIDA